MSKTTVNADQCRRNAEKKLIVATHKERKVVRSETQTQGLSRRASGMEKIEAAILKKQELVVKRYLTREDIYLAFRPKKAENNREHELKIAEIYAKIFSTETQLSFLPNTINLASSASNSRKILHANLQPYSHEHIMLNRSPALRSQTDSRFPLSLVENIQTKDKTNN